MAAWHIFPYYLGLQTAFRHGAHGARGLRQLFQVPWFTARFRVDPACYYQYDLERRWRRRREYMFHEEIVAILGDVNSRARPADLDDLGDKRRFFRRCVAAGLRTVPIIGEFENGRTARIIDDSEATDRDLFSKYATRYCGEGATLWRFTGTHYTNGDVTLTLSELEGRLASESSPYPIVLQPRIANAASLRPISGKGLSTCRIITIRRPGGAPEIALAAYRMPVGEHVADNFAVGGIACPVSLGDGVLGAGVFKSSAERDSCVQAHPDSGAAIEGRTLPDWGEAKALAIAAHAEFASMPSVGWDVVLTDSGVMLLEGNAVWCVDLAQLSHRRPLADTPIPACLAEHLRPPDDENVRTAEGDGSAVATR